MQKGTLFILSGPSGVGKGTIRENIMTMSHLNLAYSISMTTRKARVNEKDGEDYFFVSKEEFEKAKNDGELLEWAEFVGNQYGTPKSFVDKLLNSGKNVLLEIEIEGAKQVMQKCPDAITIFMVPPSFEELENRIRGRRSEPENIIQQRLSKARREMKLQNDYKYVVINNTISKASEEIANIISHYGNITK